MLTPKPIIMPVLMIILLVWACQKNIEDGQPPFEKIPASFSVSNNVKEASGIAGSKINPGYLWAQEDGGSPPQVLLLKKDGTVVKSVFINGAVNDDWEDMALSKGPNASLNYIFLADFGDNLLMRNNYTIYRFPEPALAVDTVKTVDKIVFQYPDGSHNAEALLVDHTSKEIYIITKSDNPARIYKLIYPQSITSVNQAVLVGELTFSGVTGSAISVDGKEIIIKTYPALNYFTRSPGQTIEQALKSVSVNLDYQLEPQGEAVAFAADNSGFYTLSEKAFSSVVNLYFYKRK
ncbi:MAG: hypothetical protein H7122_17765 [Chitinophagaceae bacterium]|nr:hypothetical protein [Chitinophagaceae bacterium]